MTGAFADSPRRNCPICAKPRSTEHAPFCSLRCRDRDLVQWLDDGYALPGRPIAGPVVPTEDDDEE